MIKVIHIVSHPPPYELYLGQLPPIKWENKKGETFGFWDYEWANQIFNNLINKYTGDKFLFEVWQPDFKADGVYSHVFSNGLVHRLFPAKKKISKLTLFGGKKEFFCPDMITQIKKEQQLNIVLIHSFFNSRYNLRKLLSVFSKSIPFLLQHATNTEFHPYYGINAKRNVKNKVQNFILRKFYKRVKYIFTSSNETIRNDIKDLRLFRHENLSNIGTDFKTLENSFSKTVAKNKLNLPKNKLIFFSSQRIVPEKQIDKLIEVISKLDKDNFCFYISGTGEKGYVEKLNQLILNLKISDKVKLTSYLSNHDLNLYYKAADFFISTSISEAGPDSTNKAIYFELPVITTDTGVSQEFLKSKNCGLIINRNDSTSWCPLIQKVIDNEILINRPKHEDVLAFFAWKNISNYYFDTYDEIINDFYR